MRYTGIRARRRSAVRSGTARGRVTRVGIDETVRLATHGEARGIEGAFEVIRAIRSKINLTTSNMTSDIIIDPRWQIIPINEGNIVVIVSISGGERPFGERSGRSASTGMRIAQKTTITATGKAGVRAGVRGEVAVATSPNPSSSPVIRNVKRPAGIGTSFPSGRNVRSSRADVQISKDGGPDGEWAGVIDLERPGGSGKDDGGENEGCEEAVHIGECLVEV